MGFVGFTLYEDACCPEPPVIAFGCFVEVCDRDRSYTFNVDDDDYCCPIIDDDAPDKDDEWSAVSAEAWYCTEAYTNGCDDPYTFAGGALSSANFVPITDYCAYINWTDDPYYCDPNPAIRAPARTAAVIDPAELIALDFSSGRVAWGSQRRSNLTNNTIVSSADIATKVFWAAWQIDPGDTLQTPHSIHKIRITYKHLNAVNDRTVFKQYVNLAQLDNANCDTEYHDCRTTAWPTPGQQTVWYGSFTLNDTITYPTQHGYVDILRQVLAATATTDGTVQPALANDDKTKELTSITTQAVSGSESGVFFAISTNPVCFVANPLLQPVATDDWFTAGRFGQNYAVLRVTKIETLDNMDAVIDSWEV